MRKQQAKNRSLSVSVFCVLALPIFPGRLQPSIVGRSELNFRVRDGNGWTLALISTNFYLVRSLGPFAIFSCLSLPSERVGDPWENRTPVCGVRGRRLDRLTNGPYRSCLSHRGAPCVHLNGSSGAPSGTRTQDPLIKSQLLYQLS